MEKHTFCQNNSFCAPQWSFAVFESKTSLITAFVVVISFFAQLSISVFLCSSPSAHQYSKQSSTCCSPIQRNQSCFSGLSLLYFWKHQTIMQVDIPPSSKYSFGPKSKVLVEDHLIHRIINLSWWNLSPTTDSPNSG